MRRLGGASFPVGLYGMLLLALCWLALPAPFAPVERVLLALPSLPHRLFCLLSPQPASAATSEPAARVADLQERLLARIRMHAVAGGQALLPASWSPVVCPVVAVERAGGGGLPCELRLAYTYEQLAGCVPFVTQGDALLGRVLEPGHGLAVDDRPADAARVVLQNHPAAAPVAAALALQDGGLLRMVVQPAATVDPAPMYVRLWDDPYRAAGLRRSGDPVLTLSLPDVVGDLVPPDLRLGTSLMWGYGQGEQALAIGMFVEPAVDPRSLSHVVAWRARGDAVSAPAPITARARLWELPGGAGGRWLLATSGPVPDGAAVTVDGVCLGTARGLAFGQALVTSFPTSRHRWSLLLLPDDEGGRPRELWGEVVHAADGTARLHCRGGDRSALTAGFLFTGSNGPFCPPGLLLGRAAPQPGQPEVLVVTTPAFPTDAEGRVVVAEPHP